MAKEKKIETVATKIRKIICLNYKGGACKSTVSQFILPYYFYLVNVIAHPNPLAIVHANNRRWRSYDHFYLVDYHDAAHKIHLRYNRQNVLQCH